LTGNTQAKPVLDAEESLDRLIEARAQEAEEANRVHAGWAEKGAKFDARAQAERRREWVAYHRDLARLHTRLAAEHDEKALSLMDAGARARGA
jgi:hypothetical protein